MKQALETQKNLKNSRVPYLGLVFVKHFEIYLMRQSSPFKIGL